MSCHQALLLLAPLLTKSPNFAQKVSGTFVFKFNKSKKYNEIDNEINQNYFLYFFNQELPLSAYGIIYMVRKKKKTNNFWTKFENSDCSGDLKQASQNNQKQAQHSYFINKDRMSLIF